MVNQAVITSPRYLWEYKDLKKLIMHYLLLIVKKYQMHLYLLFIRDTCRKYIYKCKRKKTTQKCIKPIKFSVRGLWYYSRFGSKVSHGIVHIFITTVIKVITF